MVFSPSKKESLKETNDVTWSQWFVEMFDGITLFYALLYEFPKYIYDRFHMDELLEAFTSNTTACCSLLTGASVIMTAAIGIGLGVGLGVGLNCESRRSITNNSITTTTAISLINSTIDTLLNSTTDVLLNSTAATTTTTSSISNSTISF